MYVGCVYGWLVFAIRNIIVKKIIILNSIFVFIFCSSSFSGNWDKTDKVLFSAFSATMAIDCVQTNYIFSSDKFYEHNPIIKSGIKEIGTGFIPLYFGVCTLGGWYASNKLKSRNRKILLSALILLETIVIVDNKNKGVGLNFKF